MASMLGIAFGHLGGKIQTAGVRLPVCCCLESGQCIAAVVKPSCSCTLLCWLPQQGTKPDVGASGADTDQEGRLDVSADNTDGVRSEYAILAPSRSGESRGSSLGNRLKLTKAMAPELFSYLRMD